MENKKKLRCPMGVPGGVLAALVGLVGAVYTAMQSEWITFSLFFGLFMLATPFIRFILMVHSANDRLDELEQKIKT